MGDWLQIFNPLLDKCEPPIDFNIEDSYQSNERREIIDDFKKFDEQTKNGLRKMLMMVTKLSPLRESTPFFWIFFNLSIRSTCKMVGNFREKLTWII